nr:immunoglobulin heavy chain junction region [Macaca mulatta]MOV49337.1 immunoglobulin heavy chain junction region [Macaca mulatta]MOV49552.1 immunoglobulin heavy chain junction region [Macaca mulatta]MOV49906.1 immunoglobulin heavy chain junction region [Macaca mulatta]MOV49923.1 immunoglobulin heavy chain junction region [Macaca mulatta]
CARERVYIAIGSQYGLDSW